MPRSRKDGAEDSVFQSRIKKLIKESEEYDKFTFCQKLNIAPDTYDKYMKTGAKLPSLDKIRDMATLLNVDVGYLLGDYNYPRMSELSIPILSTLTKKSYDVLMEVSEKESTREIFEKIIQDENFISLLLQSYKYSHSHNFETTIKDKSEVFPNETVTDPVRNKEMLKFSASDLFNQILDSLYKSNAKTSQDLLYYHHVKQLLTSIQELKSLSETKQGKKQLLKYIESELTHIRKYVKSDALILKYSPQHILENVDTIYESIAEND
ncbi:hypothetical protein [Butyrivibrio sp. XPD2006]|uniref:hypothetical protein n=1 Tax=Butyrivibrio sp. XPD2006 TaxID=1280668 RepID=UPI0003B6CE2E|nr:hypothetical protein [Butyrivibrio sp. XPD2006]